MSDRLLNEVNKRINKLVVVGNKHGWHPTTEAEHETLLDIRRIILEDREQIMTDREQFLNELEELEEIEWDNRNNQAALAYQRVQELIKERAEVAKP